MLYLDTAATTPVREEVIDAMAQSMRETYGNPSSLHALGLQAEKSVAAARAGIAAGLSCPPKAVYFTSGATEANNWALDAAWQLRFPKRRTLLIAADAHPSVLEKARSLNRRGAKVVSIPVDESGQLRLDALEDKLNGDALLFSFAWVNNETGAVQPAGRIARLVKSKQPRCLCHADAVQGFCKLPDVHLLSGIDFLSVSAHKIYGPKGVGALVAGERIVLPPLLFGGGQESGKRGGTENVAGIVGFARAAAWMLEGLKNSYGAAQRRQERFESAVRRKIPNLEINGGEIGRSPYISNVSVQNVRGEVLVHALSARGVVVSTGAACASRKKSYSHVLTAMKLPEWRLSGSVRVSFPVDLGDEDAARAADLFANAALALQETSRAL